MVWRRTGKKKGGWTKEPTGAQIVASKPHECLGCPLYNASIRVPPDVQDGVEVIAIGEAPGREERDAPFSGKSGKHIRRILEDVGLIGRVGFANTLNCRPYIYNDKGWKQNREPSDQETSKCRGQLLQTIKDHQPKVLLALGAYALRWLVPGGERSIGKARGRFFQSKYGLVFATFHPSAALHSGSDSQLRLIQSDLLRVKDYLDGTDSSPKLPDYKLVIPRWVDPEYYKQACTPPWIRDPSLDLGEWKDFTEIYSEPRFITFDEAIKLLSNTPEVRIGDIESTGLDPFDEGADIISFGFSVDRSRGYSFPVIHGDFDYMFSDPRYRKLAYKDLALIVKTIAKVRNAWHNSPFDVRWLKVILEREVGFVPDFDSRPVECTLQMHYLLHPSDRAHNMDDVAASMGYDSHKKVLKKYKDRFLPKNKRVSFAKYPFWLLGPYNALDCGITKIFHDAFTEEMEKAPHIKRFWWEHHIWSVQSFTRIMQNGMAANLPAIDIAREFLTNKLESAEKDAYFNPLTFYYLFYRLGFLVDGQTRMDLETLRTVFNLGSDVQVSRFLFGTPGTNKEGHIDEHDDPNFGIGLPRRLTKKNKKGFGVGESVILQILDGFDELKQASPYSRQIVDEETGAISYELTGSDLFRAYAGAVSRGIPPERVLAKLYKYAAPAVVDAVRARRSAQKMLSTYVTKIDKELLHDGMIYTSFKLHGTITGRFSSYFHTIPWDPMLKRMYQSRFGKDGYIVAADQGQIEARVIASMSGDPELIKIFREGRDLHREVAASFFRVPYDDITVAQRRYTKAIHFGVLYRRNAESLAKDLELQGMTPSEALQFAERFIADYFKRFPVVYEWRERLFEDVRKRGWSVASTRQKDLGVFKDFQHTTTNYVILSPFGRELRFPPDTPYKELKRLTCNYPPQSAAADITTDAIVRVEKRLHSDGFRSKVIHAIHDAGYVDTHVDELTEVCDIVQTEMTRTEMYSDWLLTPLMSDLEVGPTWGDLEAVEKSDMLKGKRLSLGGIIAA